LTLLAAEEYDAFIDGIVSDCPKCARAGPGVSNLDPALTIPLPRIAERFSGAHTAKQNGTLSVHVVGNEVPRARRWTRIAHLCPVLASLFPSVTNALSTVATEQNHAVALSIVGHTGTFAWTWTSVLLLCPK
jgi:hypothetical protein